MVNFSESGHTIFRASSAFGRGELRSKVGGKKAIHFNDGDENIELLLRTVISVNQLSIYGALADLCKELNEDSAEDSSEDSESSGKLEASDPWKTMEC